jgi:hypothetical protein
MLARTRDRLFALEREIPNATGYPCDVTDEGQLDRTIEAICRELGTPKVLIHNAVGGAFGNFMETDPQVLNRNFQVNTMALLHLARRLYRQETQRSADRTADTGSPPALSASERICGLRASGRVSAPARTAHGFEATGNYHRPLAHFLQQQGCELRLIPTVALARTREAMHNSWDKNDPKDAQVILHMLKTGLTQSWHDPLLSGTNDAQELSKTHHQITLARTRVWHSLRNHYFQLYFPEIERFIRSDSSDWLINFLLQFPTPGTITALSCEE